MRRTVVRLALLAAVLCSAAAWSAERASIPILYQVSDVDSSLYILGSIHQLRPEDSKLPAVVQQIADRSSRIYFELSPEELADSSHRLPELLQTMGFTHDGSRLTDLLSAEDGALLRTRMQSTGIPEAQWQHMRPWLAALMLELDTLKALRLESQNGVDLQLARKGKESPREQVGLETLRDQLSVLADTAEHAQLANLVESLRRPALSKAADANDAEVILQAWLRGDVRALIRVERKMKRQFPRQHATLIVERNRRWLPQLESDLRARRSGHAMVVVGALHVIGPSGIVRLLQQRGYRVRRVTDLASVNSVTATATAAAQVSAQCNPQDMPARTTRTLCTALPKPRAWPSRRRLSRPQDTP